MDQYNRAPVGLQTLNWPNLVNNTEVQAAQKYRIYQYKSVSAFGTLMIHLDAHCMADFPCLLYLCCILSISSSAWWELSVFSVQRESVVSSHSQVTLSGSASKFSCA